MRLVAYVASVATAVIDVTPTVATAAATTAIQDTGSLFGGPLNHGC